MVRRPRYQSINAIIMKSRIPTMIKALTSFTIPIIIKMAIIAKKGIHTKATYKSMFIHINGRVLNIF
jgi:hypothetical protein